MAIACGGDTRPRLVVLRALGLGDLLTAVPALRALRDSHPGHHRVLAAPRALRPLVALLGDVIHTVAHVDFRVWVGRLPLELGGPDVAVNLHGRGPESHAALAMLTPRRLIAFHDPHHARVAPAWRDDEHERVRWCRLLHHHGIPADADDLAVGPPPRPVAARWVGATVLHPGASAPSRRWPATRWADVAQYERRAGRQVVITGGRDEVTLASTVARGAGLDDEAVVAGGTDLGDLAAIVAAAGRVVSGDTGVAHLASALATPSVVLFGPTSPHRWGPPRVARHTVLWAGRTGDPHAARTHAGLLAINVSDVTTALDALPPRDQAAPA